MVHCIPIWQPPEMNLVTKLIGWIDQLIEWLFDNQPTKRVYAVNMFAVGLSNIMDDAGNVNRALINVWHVDTLVVHLYMALIVLASAGILLRREPPVAWYLPGISYMALILSSVFALFIDNPNVTTLSAFVRIFALNGLLLYLLIKNLRGAI